MANLVELYDLVIQAQALNGVPLSHGHVYVYALGRTKLMDTWSDIDGESLNPNPVILDNAGQAHIYVSDDFDYTLVFTDEFDNEIFSVDKYLLSKGEHSHADVAVAPSEHIGVSSYHVGEVTVYVPYLTGEVGKVYEGIDPIVVNNDVNRISANHIPLGVQDPLYFVEDSETACIIGCSAQTEIPSALSSKWDEASDAVIANSAQWAEGTEYEAGSYVDIDGHTISVTGLQPEGDYAYNSALSSKLDITALPQDLVHSGDLTAYYPSDNPSGFITGVDLTDYATTAQLDEKLDKTDSGNFYPMTGNPSGFLTAHQSLQGYATEQWVEDKGYLTSVDIPESATWNATTQTVSANSAQWAGGTANPQIPVTGINGIKISESGDKVVFEVSGDYATHEDVYASTSGKADISTTIMYNNKPSADAIYANENGLNYVNYIMGSGVAINPSYLWLSDSVEITPISIRAVGLSANNNDTYFCIRCAPEVISGGGGSGFTFSSQNTGFGTAKLTTADSNQIVKIYSPKFEAKNISGAGFSIEASGAKGYDHNGNVTWDTTNSPAPTQLIAGSDSPKPSIMLSPYMPKSMSAQFSNAPLFSADGKGIYIGISGQNMHSTMQGITARNGQIQAEIADSTGVVTGYTQINGGEVLVSHSTAFGSANSGTWSLTGSVQKREIEGDTATSAITAIAGSAIGGGVPQSAFDEATAKIAELENILSSYSGQWLLA